MCNHSCSLLSITKLQNLKAIHNNAVTVDIVTMSCYQSQNYKIWKQFTTGVENVVGKVKLLSITKLQNLKAIHNRITRLLLVLVVVINHKTTKFESNSQPKLYSFIFMARCYQSQNYKIWKQFTTFIVSLNYNIKLLSITKLQNLKAIHNNLFFKALIAGLLSITKLQNLKAIHNSILSIRHKARVVINHKTTKFESNSQLVLGVYPLPICCYQSQNYKIWKQFTTCVPCYLILFWLLSITKLQNLKAIHNYWNSRAKRLSVVINHKTTKFESNSQLSIFSRFLAVGCYQSQNYKIWKQFTTVFNWKCICLGCYQSQNYKIWKQFTTQLRKINTQQRLLSITKLQNLKAIHNLWIQQL